MKKQMYQTPSLVKMGNVKDLTRNAGASQKDGVNLTGNMGGGSGS